MLKPGRLLLQDVWNLYCPDQGDGDFSACHWLSAHLDEWPSAADSPVGLCDWLARQYAQSADRLHRKQQGQYFTPPAVARFMASLVRPLPAAAHVTEPGAGTGMLIAALAEAIVQERQCQSLNVVAYEIDAALRPALTIALGFTRHWLSERGVDLRYTVVGGDYLLSNAQNLRPAPLFESAAEGQGFDLVLANPPYFKLPKDDRRVGLLPEVVHGQPNIYALFMAAAAKLLKPGGQLLFITPRSFCSGPYFRQFRKWIFSVLTLERVHLFESRTDAFQRDEVLQENVIVGATKGARSSSFVQISSSYGTADLGSAQVRQVPMPDVIDLTSDEAILHIPVGSADDAILDVFRKWPDRLQKLGLEISTGPIVPFRTPELSEAPDAEQCAPVLWVQHISRMAVNWPIAKFGKPQRIVVNAVTRSLLLPNSNFVFVRRFSPKEDNSRLTAAPYLAGELSGDCLGVENHVNYVHRPGGTLLPEEALGLAAFLNSRWVDHYFRVLSSNTQVSATELRALPVPPLTAIRTIGAKLIAANGVSKVALINQVVGEVLHLPELSASKVGGHMSKIEEAKDLLKALGLPPPQHNELAALTLLALAGLEEGTPWRQAQRRSLRIHDMILFIERAYGKRYAENTRETFRRQVLHQFEQARIVDRNPDDESLPTNSPKTHYALSEDVLPAIRGYGTAAGQRRIDTFISSHGTLLEAYQARRSKSLLPVKDLRGNLYHLSPGKHNQLQIKVIEEFVPRFAKDAQLLYLGDTANKSLIIESDRLQRLGFPANKHSKLPDIVLYSPKKRWLYLIEVVTSHGPVSPKRHRELEKLLSECKVGRIYVSVFAEFKEYLRHARNIAWDTEIWLAEAPDHLIHYNGDRFIGPR